MIRSLVPRRGGQNAFSRTQYMATFECRYWVGFCTNIASLLFVLSCIQKKNTLRIQLLLHKLCHGSSSTQPVETGGDNRFRLRAFVRQEILRYLEKYSS